MTIIKVIVGRFTIGLGGDGYEEIPKKSQAFLRGGKVALTRGKERAGDKLPRYDVKRSVEVYPRQEWVA